LAHSVDSLSSFDLPSNSHQRYSSLVFLCSLSVLNSILSCFYKILSSYIIELIILRRASDVSSSSF